MTDALSPLLAADAIRTTFEWGRIQSNSDWILPIGIFIAILLFVWRMYRRDSVELRPVWGWLLTALRMATFLGLLILFLQPHWRSEREEVRNSRVLVLADTSLSMGTADGGASASSGVLSRSQQLAKALKESDFLARLRKTHDVAVFPFSEDLRRDRMVTLNKMAADNDKAAENAPESQPGTDVAKKDSAGDVAAPDWSKRLAPTGIETRLGQALRQLIQEERGTPVSGVVVLSDGGQNAGIPPESAVALAQEAKIPVFTVGLGSDRQPTNITVCDLAAPVRAYPGDHYTVTGYLQAHGMAGKTVTVQMFSRPAATGAGGNQKSPGEPVASQPVTLGGDGEMLPVKFDLVSEATGRRTLTLRVQAPEGDRNAADNQRETDVEIVDRKNHVLLLAGGAMRDYQFLRNLLYRDRYTTVDVLLQSAPPGISQEAKKILDGFPSTRGEMFDYDCVVAFDPDWTQLKAKQIELLEKWVGEQGGGLIVVTGPVDACKGPDSWVQSPNMNLIRNLYPVEFFGRMATTEGNMYSSREPWPLDFTREGMEADFLWLADSATASSKAWASFPGVYSFCPVRGTKPGATVYARFSDPSLAQANQGPVYFAGQFYGAGSVFYMGSAEMWRLRTVDDTYFAQFYTKLIRHVSQGRLLRGSTRGVLLVGQDRYLLGNTVEVRAQLTNARLEPLDMPTVNLQVVQPDGTSQTVALRADSSRLGAYSGQFPALQEGTYRIELPVPESENERLSRRVQVRVPDLERENPRRNDAVLSAIAKNSGGKYYVGTSSAFSPQGTPPLVEELKDRTTTTIMPITPDPRQEESWLRGMMIALCSLLCLEWLIRRLLKLA
jgi:hypothetical protein